MVTGIYLCTINSSIPQITNLIYISKLLSKRFVTNFIALYTMQNNKDKWFFPFLAIFTLFLLIMLTRNVIRKADYGFEWWFEDIISCDSLYYYFALPSVIMALSEQGMIMQFQNIKKYFFLISWNLISMLIIAPLIIHWGFLPVNIAVVFLYVAGFQNLCLMPIAIYRKKTAHKEKGKLWQIATIILIAVMPWCIFEVLQASSIKTEHILYAMVAFGIISMISAKYIIKGMLLMLTKK